MAKAPETLNLVPAIREVEAQIHRLTVEFEEKIKPYNDSLAALKKANTACERCEGTGKVLRSRACAEDDRPDPDDPKDWNTCPVCHGTGYAKTKKGTQDTNDWTGWMWG